MNPFTQRPARLYLLLAFFMLLSVVHAQKKSKVADKPKVNEYGAIDTRALALPDSLTASVAGIAGYINQNFTTSNEKVRAIFIWVANNLEYDVQNMFAINYYETRQQKIAKALLTKKGICEHYAALFDTLCTQTGIKAVVVEGYCKQNGFVDYIPHAWCAAYVDSAWYMFDPTWGSGYIYNEYFTRKINNSYFKQLPTTFIKDHMPFDPLWQFMLFPFTPQDFYAGRIVTNTPSYFNYEDSILVYQKQDYLEQLISTANRIEKGGLKNSMLFDRLQHIKMDIEIYKQNAMAQKQKQQADLYNSASALYTDGINGLNEFINYRNQHFEPIKPDAEMRSMLDSVAAKFDEARQLVNNIKDPDPANVPLIKSFYKAEDEAKGNLDEQNKFLKEYLSKGKAGRRNMFYVPTVFGVPVR